MTVAHPRSRLRILFWSAAGALMLAPALAMQVTDAVVWGPFDFLVFGALVAFGLAGLELALRASTLAHGLALALAALASGLLVWLSLAVGLNGEGGRADLIYALVLTTGLLGAGLARLRPAPMARVMAAMAGAQILAGLVSVAAGLVPSGAGVQVLSLNALFAGWFALTALLFARAAKASKAV